MTEPVSDLTVRVPATTSTEQLSPAAEPTVGLPVTVIGVADERLDLLSPEARQALVEAEVVVGGRRQLWLWQSWPGRPPVGPGGWTPETLEVGADVDELARTVRQRAVEASRRVCVLASGDPGFFGIVRALVRMVDRRALRVLPAPSSVSQAFARLGLPWDDAMVVSVYGRSLADAASILRTAPKAAVLTSPDSPPEAVGRALLEAGAIMDLVAVCSRLGSSEERVTELTLSDLAAGRFDPLSVVVLIGPGSLPLVGWAPGHARQEGGDANGPVSAKVLAWGLPDSAFTHRAGMITKAEVRSVALGKLALPAAGVLWDVGAGSGSVAVECALLRPGLTVLAVEESPDDAARASTNAVGPGGRGARRHRERSRGAGRPALPRPGLRRRRAASPYWTPCWPTCAPAAGWWPPSPPWTGRWRRPTGWATWCRSGWGAASACPTAGGGSPPGTRSSWCGDRATAAPRSPSRRSGRSLEHGGGSVASVPCPTGSA